MTSTREFAKQKTSLSTLQLYSRGVPFAPSIFEIRNQAPILINFVILTFLYHNYGQRVWDYFNSFLTIDQISLGWSFLLLNAIFAFWSLFFYFLDSNPQWFNKYRMQSFREVNISDYKKAVKQAFINLILIGGPLSILMHIIYKKINKRDLTILPSIQEIAIDHVVFIVLEEIAFYFTHRLMHEPFFYKHIHKKHHEFVAPIAVAAVYAHPIQHLICNLLPLAIGPMVMRSHVATYNIWIIISLTGTAYNHSNYSLPGMNVPVNHDFHHYVQQENFGVFGIMDHLLGSDTEYKKMLELVKKRKQSEQGRPATRQDAS